MKKIVLYGKDLPKDCTAGLTARAEKGICLPASPLLSEPVNTHPDTLLYADGELLFCGRKYLKENAALFECAGITPIEADDPKSPYPDEVKLNAFTLNGVLIGRLDVLDAGLRNSCKKAINVKQGYARCLTAKVAENAYISSDRGIAEAVKKVGGDCLLISHGHIRLRGHDYGFIGGASVLCGNELLFFGDVTRHPDFDAMREYAAKYGTALVSLSNEDLTDCGGAIYV